ncbi:MAG TPA: protein kinase [Anaerolineae bacterium]
MFEAQELVGHEINQYKINQYVAQGSMAYVYRGRDTSLERDVAIKILHPELMLDNKFVTRFQHEAKVIARLRHPNIVQVYAAGTTSDGYHYIVMEYVEGGTLADKLARSADSAFDATPALLLIRQVAEALAVAHRVGIVHRDVKPSNILLQAEGMPVLADLGLALALDESRARLTLTGTLLGTPGYISPEQVSGRLLDGRSDIYSLGIILYELLAGRRPFDDPSPLEVIRAHLQQEPTRLEELRPGLARQTYVVVHTCIRKAVADRYETADQLVKALNEAMVAEDGRVTQAAPLEQESPAPAPDVTQLWSFAEEPAAEEANKTQLWSSDLDTVGEEGNLTQIWTPELSTPDPDRTQVWTLPPEPAESAGRTQVWLPNQDEASALPPASGSKPFVPDAESNPVRQRRWIYGIAATIALVAIVALFFLNQNNPSSLPVFGAGATATATPSPESTPTAESIATPLEESSGRGTEILVAPTSSASDAPVATATATEAATATLPQPDVQIRADSDIVRNKANRVSEWSSPLAEGLSLLQASSDNQPLWLPEAFDGSGALVFEGNDFLVMADSLVINLGGPFAAKTLALVFQTGADVTSRQVLWEQGGSFRGLNIYIDGGSVYVNSWNVADDDQTTPWGPVFSSAPVATNATYGVILLFDAESDRLTGFLNGNQMTDAAGVGLLFSHAAGSLGGILDDSFLHDGPAPEPGNYFTGQIAEFLSYNRALGEADLQALQANLAGRYALASR